MLNDRPELKSMSVLGMLQFAEGDKNMGAGMSDIQRDTLFAKRDFVGVPKEVPQAVEEDVSNQTGVASLPPVVSEAGLNGVASESETKKRVYKKTKPGECQI